MKTGLFKKKSRLSLRIKAILSIIALEVVILGTFGYLSVKKYHGIMEASMKKNYFWLAKTLAMSLSMPLKSNEIYQIESLLNQTIKDQDLLYLILRDSNGKIVASKQKSTFGLSDLNIDEFQLQPGQRIREVGALPSGLFHRQGHLFEITEAIGSSFEPNGWLQLGLSTIRLNQAVADTAYWGIRLMVLFLIIGAALVTLIDRKVKQTISRLIKTTRQMAEGDFSERVEAHTGDALEELGNSFNRMADMLLEREAQIRKDQQNLENTVTLRTKQLLEEKTKLQAILDHVPSGFLLLDKNMRIQMASDNFEQISGREMSNFLGRCCSLSLWTDHLCESCTTERALLSGKLETEVVRVEREPGSVQYFEHSAIPIMNNGQIEYILEIITDVTESRLLQEQMIRAEKLAATGEMAAVIAHEMRNSLTSVKMILQLLMESANNNGSDIESVQVALNSVERSERVVKQLLQFSRPNPLRRHWSDLKRIVQESIDMTEHQFKRHGITMDLKLASDIPFLQVDAEKIKEALVNLLLNAAQAIDGIGQVTVTISVVELRTEFRDFFSLIESESLPNDSDQKHYREICLPKGTRVVSIEVKDTGCGISSDQLDRIFDPFFTTKIDGTGLGLSLVKRIVNEHGGVVRVKSKKDKGSILKMILPLSQNV
jgi:PAS domain S-box-containing protein